MTQNDLTGIERQLVLEYLIDGNAPVTITQEESDAAATGKAVSRIFPVAVRAEQMTVLNQGIILLKDAPESVQYFDGKRVRVQFYFNKLGLYFTSTVKRTRHALALVIPDVISRIRDAEPPQSSDMSCVLYFEAGKEKRTGALHVDCRTESPYSLFTVPKWSDVDCSGWASRLKAYRDS